MFEAYCKLLSTALQFGVPLKEVVKGFRNYSFEPSGFCRVGDDTEADTCTEIRSCASVVDLIAKILAWLFPESNGYRLRDVFSIPSVSLPGQAPDTTVSVLPPASSPLRRIPLLRPCRKFPPERFRKARCSTAPPSARSATPWPMSRTANANPAAPADTRTAAAVNKR